MGGNSDHEYKWTPQCTELQMSALQAMSAVLCCGPCFDPNGLAEDDCYYAWLNMLLASQDDRVSNDFLFILFFYFELFDIY